MDRRQRGANSVIGLALFACFVLLTVLAIGPASDASAHYWVADDGCGPGTSSDGYFWAFGNSWTTDTSSGYNGCYMKTPNTYSGGYGTCGSCEFAEWYLPLTTNYNHTYEVWTNIDTYICDEEPALVGDGHYHRWQYGHSGGITEHVWWDQSENCDGGWESLDVEPICGSSGGLWDQVGWTGVTTNSYFVFTDVIFFAEDVLGHSC